MAEVIDEQKYEEMISALSQFASNVYVAASEMQSCAVVCVSAIGEEDNAVSSIYKGIEKCGLKYTELAKMAKGIVDAMQRELEKQKREKSQWQSEE